MQLRATRLTCVASAARRAGAGSVFASAQVAHALRVPAGSTYAGPLVRVRRSSDNVEADIGAAGPQMAQNRKFATDTLWTKAVGVTITGGAMVVGSTVARIAGQDMGLVTGRTYKVSVVFDKTGTNALATIRVSTSDTLAAEGANQTVIKTSPPIGARSIGQCTIVATAPNLVLASSDGYFTGSIVFVSVQEVSTYTWLDEYALLAHVGTGNGYVRTWYSQLPVSGMDLANTTAANQLMIASNGVLTTNSAGKPAVKCDPGWLQWYGQSMTVQQINVVAEATSSMTNYAFIVGFRNQFTSAQIGQDSAFSIALGTNGASPPVGLFKGTGNNASAFFLGAANQTTAFNAGNAPVALNTPFIATLQSISSVSGAAWGALGVDPYDVTGRRWQGTVSELVMHASNQSTSDRLVLERSQGTAFGITVA